MRLQRPRSHSRSEASGCSGCLSTKVLPRILLHGPQKLIDQHLETAVQTEQGG